MHFQDTAKRNEKLVCKLKLEVRQTVKDSLWAVHPGECLGSLERHAANPLPFRSTKINVFLHVMQLV
jgi:hypothetical protein